MVLPDARKDRQSNEHSNHGNTAADVCYHTQSSFIFRGYLKRDNNRRYLQIPLRMRLLIVNDLLRLSVRQKRETDPTETYFLLFAMFSCTLIIPLMLLHVLVLCFLQIAGIFSVGWFKMYIMSIFFHTDTSNSSIFMITPKLVVWLHLQTTL